MTCRFVATDEARVLMRRHDSRCQGAGPYWHPPIAWVDCAGCLPCPEAHCVVCGRNHAAVTCPDCLGATREDLEAIGVLCSALPDEAVEKGVESEAMMLLGPAADHEGWSRATWATYATQAHLEAEGTPAPELAAYLNDCRDELHPLYVLGGWDQVWRDHLDHQTDKPATLPSVISYLMTQLGYMADQPEPPFEEFARELRQCRGHLEDVLRDGIREEKGAPCVQCGTRMTRLTTKQGAQDSYRCPSCRREVSADQYHYAVGVAYRAHALALTAVDLGERLGIKPSVIRVWGARGVVRKRGRTVEGAYLYDVADVQARCTGGEKVG